MYQPKVSETQEYLGEVVHKGKLILLDKINLEVYASKGDLAKSDKTGELYIHNGGVLSSRKMHPIVISETEEIEEGDKVLCETELGYMLGEFKKKEKDQYVCVTDLGTGLYYFSSCHKVLALPEHFSYKVLRGIARGKSGHGEDIFIKCSRIKGWDNFTLTIKRALKKGKMPTPCIEFNEIYVNDQNHVTLFAT